MDKKRDLDYLSSDSSSTEQLDSTCRSNSGGSLMSVAITGRSTSRVEQLKSRLELLWKKSGGIWVGACLSCDTRHVKSNEGKPR